MCYYSASNVCVHDIQCMGSFACYLQMSAVRGKFKTTEDVLAAIFALPSDGESEDDLEGFSDVDDHDLDNATTTSTVDTDDNLFVATDDTRESEDDGDSDDDSDVLYQLASHSNSPNHNYSNTTCDSDTSSDSTLPCDDSDEFPAVTVPLNLSKIGFNLFKASIV